MKDDIFESYIGNLMIYYNKYARDIKNSNNKEETSKKYKEIIYAIFHLYRDILTTLHLDQLGKSDCFREPTKEEEKEYTCSMNTEKNVFPLVRVLEYRHEKFPEYIDDYGMETFIEFKDFEGNIKHVRTNDADWDYELDRTFDVDRLSYIDPQEAVELLYNDIWFKS